MKFDWFQNGEHWFCDANDHGPFCRLCFKLNDDKATQVVDAIWYNLMGRSGFGSALDDADQDMEDEIKAELMTIVRSILR